MKYAEFDSDSSRIEFFNSLFGNEKILVNGREVSSKFSFFGTKHDFLINSEKYTLSSSFTALGKRELFLKLEKNRQVVENLAIDLNPNYRTSWGALIIIFGIIFFNFLKD